MSDKEKGSPGPERLYVADIVAAKNYKGLASADRR